MPMAFDLVKVKEAADRFIASTAMAKEKGYRLWQEEVDGLLLANWFLVTTANCQDGVIGLTEAKGG
jgi:hypothetical protein